MILDDIIYQTKKDLDIRKLKYSFSHLEDKLKDFKYIPLDVKRILKSTKKDPIKIIAEVKNILNKGIASFIN